MKLKVYSADGKSNSSVELDKLIADASASDKLTVQVVQRMLANSRQSNAHTKNRGEVSGGGRKPFKQKGTGNARAGSTRSPLWIGGGVTFGPRKIENYSKRLPRKMGHKAMQVALNEKAKSDKWIVVESFPFKKVQTKQMQSFLEKLPIEDGRIILVLAKTNPSVELSASNLGFIKTVQVAGLNIIDLLKYDYLLTDKEGLAAMQKLFGEHAK